MKNEIIIFFDTICKKKFIINSPKIEINEKILINNNLFKLKKINISIKSHKIYKKNKKFIKDKIEKNFEKKYKILN